LLQPILTFIWYFTMDSTWYYKQTGRKAIVTGHYGSGKTNLAVNYAIALRQMYPGIRIVLADLDIVNPYFRSVDSVTTLNALGIEIIASQYANSNVELPAMPSEILTIFDDKACIGVVDLGGDDRGANAIGKYSDNIRAEDANVLMVCNKYRPLSREPVQVLAIKNEIEAAAGIRFTGIVNNSNLGAQTTPQDVYSSAGYINEVSALCGLPVAFTSAASGLACSLSGIPDLFAITIFKKEAWKID